MCKKNIEESSMPCLTSTFKYYLENIIKFSAKIGKKMLIKIVSICQMAMTKMNIVSKQSNDVHVKNKQMHN